MDGMHPWERRQSEMLAVKIDAESAEKLEQIAEKMGIPKSRLIKRLIWDYLAEQEEPIDTSEN